MFKKTLCQCRSLASLSLIKVAALSTASARNMSQEAIKTINFSQLKQFIEEKSIYLVDVREKTELEETGVLPNSVNIPLGEVESALQLSDEDFASKYGSEKPKQDETVVFSCKAGGRSLKATGSALKLGFSKALNYGGGWLDWEKNIKS